VSVTAEKTPDEIDGNENCVPGKGARGPGKGVGGVPKRTGGLKSARKGLGGSVPSGLPNGEARNASTGDLKGQECKKYS